MTTRLSALNTFAIEFMNFMKYSVPFFQNRSVEFSKFWGVSTYLSFEKDVCFRKFHQLFTYWFFVFEIGKNLWENIGERFTRKPPGEKVSTIDVLTSAFDKMNLPTESLKEPRENWQFCISALKQDFVNKVGIRFCGGAVNAKTTLCINKTSQISEIQFGRSLCVNQFRQPFFVEIAHKIVIFFYFLKADYQRRSFFIGRRVQKFYQGFGFCPFFYKVRQNPLGKFKRFFSAQDKMILGFVTIAFLSITSQMFGAGEFFRHKFNNIQVGRANDKRTKIFGCSRRWSGLLSDVKATIPVGVACYVR